jgi:hypothetical protein
MKSLTQQFAIVGGSIAFTLAVSSALPVQAALLQSFFVDVLEGDLAGETYKGSFTYEESLLSGSGPEILSAGDGLSLSFDFLGNTYTEADDFSYANGLLPSISFSDGLFQGLSYLVDTGDIFFSIDEGTGQGLPGTSFAYEIGAVGAVTDVGSGQLRTETDNTSVPEPATLLGLLIAGGLGLTRNNRRGVEVLRS